MSISLDIGGSIPDNRFERRSSAGAGCLRGSWPIMHSAVSVLCVTVPPVLDIDHFLDVVNISDVLTPNFELDSHVCI